MEKTMSDGHISTTKREMWLLRQLEGYINLDDLEMGHPVRGIFIELAKLRQKQAQNKAEADARRMAAIARRGE